jgi:hypothetical protein
MEAPRSLKQKDGEPTMSYINKGNYRLLKGFKSYHHVLSLTNLGFILITKSTLNQREIDLTAQWPKLHNLLNLNIHNGQKNHQNFIQGLLSSLVSNRADVTEA